MSITQEIKVAKDENTCLHISNLFSELRTLFRELHFDSMFKKESSTDKWVMHDNIFKDVQNAVMKIQEKLCYEEDVNIYEELRKARQEIIEKYKPKRMETELCQK